MARAAVGSANLSVETTSNHLRFELTLSQKAAQTGMFTSQKNDYSCLTTSEKERTSVSIVQT